MPAARRTRARPGRGFLEPCSALSVVKARAFLGSATTCRANSIAHRPRASYDPAASPADQQATEPVPVMEAERAPEPPAPPVPALTIDALGRKCPIPIIMLADQIRNVPL